MKRGDRIQQRYQILEELGRGGSARIFRVQDEALHREVALKILKPAEKGQFQPGIQAEAHLLAKLNHPGIVTVFDCGRTEDSLYLVMELISGRTVTEILAESELGLSDTMTIAEATAEAMSFAHDQGIVHRDLTLNNIMIDGLQTGSVSIKVLDFGLGLNTVTGRDALRGFRVGTARFMPPEQFAGRNTDERADIYSFGVGLYRLLAGQFPFNEKEIPALEYQITHVPAPRPATSANDDLVDLVMRCLEKDPERRPQSFREISTVLAGLRAETVVGNAVGSEPTSTATRVGNPYLNRVMIQDMRDFFGRSREIRKIYARLDASPPQSISVVGDRRIGKSSLLNYLYQPANRRHWMSNAADAVFIFLDFQSDVEFTTEHFLQLMIEGLPTNCLDRKTDKTRPTFRDLEQAVIRLDGEGKRLIVLMDEFEKITNNANFEQGFFSFLRHLANHYRVAYVTSSEEELMRMCHAREISDSPFFNIFSNLPLGPLTRQEARELVIRPSTEAGASLETYADRLIELAGRIPMFLQIFCAVFFEEAIARPEAVVSWDAVRAECMAELRPHLEYIWIRMPETERTLLAGLVKHKKPAAHQRHLAEDLRRRGLVRIEEGRELVFSETFADFVLEGKARGGSWVQKLFSRGRSG